MTDKKKPPDVPKPPLNNEDKALWDAFTGENQVSPEEEDFEALLKQSEAKDDNTNPKEKIITPAPHGTKSSIQHGVPQLDAATERRLKRGEIPIEKTLDLHGMRQTEAHKALQDFIIASATSNLRCVLVITGKGLSGKTSENWLEPSKGVLKEKVPQWLQSGVLNQYVLKFFPAQPKHGGTGALYVYLKRQRQD